jgi:purine-nucleoside phosphorylase
MTTQVLKKYPSKKAIILGSGVSVFSDKDPLASIPYSDIDNWPLGTVKGHKGVLDIYEGIWVLRGRAHLYEGFTWKEACFPTQFLIDHGVEELILTNAAGGLNESFEIGDLMQITGYLNMLEPNKVRGNIDVLTQSVKNFETQRILPNEVFEPALHHGNYIGVHGPNYETDLEVGVFRALGADAVGMSTIPEIETAVNNNISVQAISVITNVYGKTEDLGHEGVVVAAKNASAKLTELLGIS